MSHTRLNLNENGSSVVLENLYSNPLGRIDTIDTEANEVIVLKPNGAVIEFLGMPKGGKSAQISRLLENLKKDEQFGGLEVEVFKPNTLQKLLFSKDPDTRSAYHDSIISKHKSTLNDLYQRVKGESIGTKEIDLAIFDRSLIDDLIWTEYLNNRIRLSPEDRDYFIRSCQFSQGRIHLAIGMNVAPQEAMKREGETEGNVMNSRSLEQLYLQYVIFDYLNDPVRKEEIKSSEKYSPYLEEFLGTKAKVSTYYDFMKLTTPDYLGIECDPEANKDKDREKNADRIFTKTKKVLAARMQIERTEA
jgi:hypothetical protein